jgi:hypothetical protein
MHFIVCLQTGIFYLQTSIAFFTGFAEASTRFADCSFSAAGARLISTAIKKCRSYVEISQYAAVYFAGYTGNRFCAQQL